MRDRRLEQWCILVFGSADVMRLSCEKGVGGAHELLRGENFLKQGLKQGLLVHSEQIVGWRWTLDISFVYYCTEI